MGWETNDNYIPTGEWPVCLDDLDDNLNEDILPVAAAFALEQAHKKFTTGQELVNLILNYETWEEDCDAVMESMGKSLRKIGYLE